MASVLRCRCSGSGLRLGGAPCGMQHSRPGRSYPALVSLVVLFFVLGQEVASAGVWEGVLRSLYSENQRASRSFITASSASGDYGVVQPLPASHKCVFVLGTGRSGSSSLADALNQLPNYFIRGEHSAAFYHLFNAYRRLNATWQHAVYSQRQQIADASAESGQALANVTSPLSLRPSYGDVKSRYSTLASKWRLPGFNDLHPDRVREAVRSMYTLLYGYHGRNVVSGFKEVRYGFFRKALALRCTDHADGRDAVYAEFSEFMRFMRSMCVNVKFILNSRSSAKVEHNLALKKMTARLKTNATFELTLNRTHNWYDRYAAEHPDHALRVVMEDMFNPQRSELLAARILTFLGEDPKTRITFDRMPAWTVSAEGADEGGHGANDNSSSSSSKDKRDGNKSATSGGDRPAGAAALVT